MENHKIVDELIVKLTCQASASLRTCFVVFSSKERHVETVISCIETVFQQPGRDNYDVVRLDTSLKSEDSQYEKLQSNLSTCSFAIVILDGFRPNVLFEYGFLKGLGKPCIILISDDATVDIKSYFSGIAKKILINPLIDMDKHFSDVKDRYYKRYNQNNPKHIRSILRTEYKKLAKEIREEFLNVIFPHRALVQEELKVHLTTLVSILNKAPHSIEKADIRLIDNAHFHIDRIAKKYSVSLPPHYFITLARTYEKANAIDKAIGTLNNSLSEDPNNIKLLTEQAYIYHRAGKQEETLLVLDTAIKIDPRIETLWHGKAITYDVIGKSREAEYCYKKAISLNSDCPTVHYHYGILLYQKGTLSSAIKEFRKALTICPDNNDFLLWYSRALAAINHKEKARKILEKILDRDARFLDAWYVMGQIEEDDERALLYYSKILELNPKHAGALCSSASSLAMLGKYQEAIEIFENISKVCPGHKRCKLLLTNTCKTLWKLDRTREAITLIDKYLSAISVNESMSGSLISSVIPRGKRQMALHMLKKLALFDPHDPYYPYHQACLYALLNDQRKALISLKDAIELDPALKKTALKDLNMKSLCKYTAFQSLLKN